MAFLIGKAFKPRKLFKTNVLCPPLQDGKCAFIRMTGVQFGNSSEWHVPYCNSLSRAECHISCPSRVITELVTSAKVDGSEVTHLYQFWVLFLFLALCYIGMAVVVSLSDAICFGLLGLCLLLFHL